MATSDPLQDITRARLETIQPSTFIEALTKSQTATFKLALGNLAAAITGPSRRAHLVFRGETLSRLANKLSSNGGALDHEKIPGLLFYFGDKARHFYKETDPAAKRHRWLKRIEDTDDVVCSEVFKATRLVLEDPAYAHFKTLNRPFSDYFLDDNEAHFDSKVKGDQTARDYYLFLLHTADKLALGENSVLVSTSTSYDRSRDFSGGPPGGCVIYYVISEPLEQHAVSHMRLRSYESTIAAKDLPTYDGKALYMPEFEIAVRGALFAHKMLGIRLLDGDRFIVNPHLFQHNRPEEAVITGFDIDQSDFESLLAGTGYRRGVGTILDGSYNTVAPANRTP